MNRRILNIFILALMFVSFSRPIFSYTSLSIDISEEGKSFNRLNEGLNQGEEFSYPNFLEPVIGRLRDEIGAKIVRIDHLYDKYVEVSYNKDQEIICKWEKLDIYVKNIIDIGAKPLMCLSYMPSSLREDPSAGIGSPPKNYEDWQKLVKMTVLRYNKEKSYNIEYWEVWNEPENKSHNFWKGRAEGEESLNKLIKLYEYSVKGIEEAEKEGNLKVKIGGFGLAGRTTHIIERLIQENLRVDFISWHHYGNLSGGNFDLEKLKEEIVKIRTIIGNEKELVISEWNASITDTLYGRMINRSHIGAAYAAAAISTMIDNGIKLACFSQIREGYSASTWGLGMFYPDPKYIKPVFNIFKLYHQLEPYQITLKSTSNPYLTGGMATQSKDGKMTKIIIWHRGEEKELINLDIRGLNFDKITITRYLVDEENSNGGYFKIDTAYPNLINKRQELDIFEGPTIYDNGGSEFTKDNYNISFYLRPHSVTFLEIKGEVIPLEIVGTYPVDEAIDKINIAFNVKVGKMDSFEMKDKDNNKVLGVIENHQKYITFIPENPLLPGTNYQIIIKDIESAVGSKIAEYKYNFTLPVLEKKVDDGSISPEISYIIPPLTENTLPSRFIHLGFNTKLDEITINSENIRLFSDNKEIAGMLSYHHKDKVINFFPKENLFYNKSYTLTLFPNIKSSYGKPLIKEYIYHFTTINYPLVSSNLSGKSKVPLNTPIELNFTDKVYWSATPEPKLTIYEGKNILVSFSLEEWKDKDVPYPDLKVSDWQCSYDDSKHKITLKPPEQGSNYALKINTTYSVKLVYKETNWLSFSFTTLSQSSNDFESKKLKIIERFPPQEYGIDPPLEVYVIFNTDIDESTIDSNSIVLTLLTLESNRINGECKYIPSTKKLVFIPSESLPDNRTFKVVVSQNIKNIYGSYITYGNGGWYREWAFGIKKKSNTYPLIAYRFPKVNEEDISIESKIVVEFTANIRQEMVNERSFFVKCLEDESILNGNRNIEPKKITFTPLGEGLKLGKVYEVYVKKEIGLEKDEVWKFTTKFLAITKVYPKEKTEIESYLEVSLNEKISQKSNIIFTLLRDDQYNIPGRVSYSNKEKKVLFLPKEKLAYNATYRAAVVIKDEDNNYVSKSWAFRTKEGLRPILFYPYNNEEDVPIDCDIGVRFNLALDKEGIIDNNFILISHGQEIAKNLYYKEISKELFVIPQEKLQYTKNYKIIIKSNLRSIDGDYLDQTYTWSFNTKSIPLLLIKDRRTSKEIYQVEGEKILAEDELLDKAMEKTKNFSDLNYKNSLILRQTSCKFNLSNVKYNPNIMYLDLVLPYKKEVENLVNNLSNLKIFYLDEVEKILNLVPGKQILNKDHRQIKSYPSQVHTYYMLLENIEPHSLSLISVFPNPFHPLRDKQVTFISLPSERNITIKLYTINGEIVRILDDNQEIFSTRAVWDGKNEQGNLVASGIYIYVIDFKNERTEVGKIAIIK